MRQNPGFEEVQVNKVSGLENVETTDALAVEEPLEIRLGFFAKGKYTHRPVSITMRTPGDDSELATGFLFTEGIVRSPDQIAKINHCGPKDTEGETNTIKVDLLEGFQPDIKSLERHFYTTSSCGVCGKSSIEALYTGATGIESENFRIDPSLIRSVPETLREKQAVFERTGGLHASGLFDGAGNLLVIREDVGRHNALDKVIGERFLKGESRMDETVLMVSGRASFELVQKALMAGIPVMLAVGPPSTLAVELASEFGMTLVGFVRNGGYNVYSGAERVSGSL